MPRPLVVAPNVELSQSLLYMEIFFSDEFKYSTGIPVLNSYFLGLIWFGRVIVTRRRCCIYLCLNWNLPVRLAVVLLNKLLSDVLGYHSRRNNQRPFSFIYVSLISPSLQQPWYPFRPFPRLWSIPKLFFYFHSLPSDFARHITKILNSLESPPSARCLYDFILLVLSPSSPIFYF